MNSDEIVDDGVAGTDIECKQRIRYFRACFSGIDPRDIRDAADMQEDRRTGQYGMLRRREVEKRSKRRFLATDAHVLRAKIPNDSFSGRIGQLLPGTGLMHTSVFRIMRKRLSVKPRQFAFLKLSQNFFMRVDDDCFGVFKLPSAGINPALSSGCARLNASPLSAVSESKTDSNQEKSAPAISDLLIKSSTKRLDSRAHAILSIASAMRSRTASKGRVRPGS